jgi:glycosyltransferase involved in cell wall biosynthesis
MREIEENPEKKTPFTILAVGSPFEHTGGGRRTLMVLMEEAKSGAEIYLYIPYDWLRWTILNANGKTGELENLIQQMQTLESSGVKIPDVVYRLLRDPHKYMYDETLRIQRSKYKYLRWSLNTIFESYENQRIAYLSEFAKSIPVPAVIYAYNESLSCIRDLRYLSKKSNSNVVALLQSKPYGNFNFKLFLRTISEGYFPVVMDELLELLPRLSIRREVKRLCEQKNFKAFFSVSESCFEFPGASKLKRKYHITFQTIYPALSVETNNLPAILQRKKGILFYARLIPEKGILDIIHIIRYLDKDVEVKIAGQFKDDRLKRIFLEKTAGFNLRYIGYLSREELFEQIGQARVLLYPSHFDSFSLVVLETLSRGTCVVAYDIPALTINYSQLKPVILVPEFHYKSMAYACNEILRMSDLEYAELFHDTKVREFLKSSSTWNSVAEQELAMLRSISKVS